MARQTRLGVALLMRRVSMLLTIAALGCGRTCSSAENTSVIPAELADSESLELFVWRDAPVFGDGLREKQTSADRAKGAEQALWEHGNRDMNNFVCARAADAPASRVRFNYDLPECPETYVRGVVIGRFDGPGRLSRLWLTASSFRESGPDRERLKIWVDDAPNASVDVALRDALDGSAGEVFAPPFGAGNVRRMAWYYPVVFSKRLIVAIDRLGEDDLYFHQVDVVLDQQPRARPAPAARLGARDAAVKQVGSPLASAGQTHSRALELAPGQRGEPIELAGPGTIVKTVVRTRNDALGALRNVVVEARWDEAESSAIALPLPELFGGFDAFPSPSSSLLGSRPDGDRFELWLALPMPFAKKASWRLENRGATPASFELGFVVTPEIPSRPWGHLSTQRFETQPGVTETHPLARADGRGRLAGVCMWMRGHGMMEGNRRGHPMHFLEGDELMKIDGRAGLVGTGTEDYFNSSFYFDDGPSATPFAQVWDLRESPSGGRAAACRWHVLTDAVDFRQSFELGMEVGPGVPDVLDQYRSVAYLYR